MNEVADTNFDYLSTTHIGEREMTLDGSNIGYHRERVEAWERGERVAPIFMDIAWTRKCQAACYFCAAQVGDVGVTPLFISKSKISATTAATKAQLKIIGVSRDPDHSDITAEGFALRIMINEHILGNNVAGI